MARSTAFLASGLTRGEPLTTRDTVARETPATSPTCSSVGCVPWPRTVVTDRLSSSRIASQPVPRDDIPVPQRAVLERARLRLVVDVHEAEPGRVALRPLEVVEQRPDEVPAQVRARRHGSAGRTEVLLQEPDAIRVVDAPGLRDVVAVGS